MGENNGYVIKTVFWTLIISCFIFAAGAYAFSYAGQVTIASKLSDAIVCNDRMRSSEDSKIKEGVEAKLDKIIDIQSQQSSRLARIEQKLEMR